MISEFGGCIKKYDVFEELGRGGFGIVERAKCHNTHKDVAIKKINKNSLIDEKFIERVRQEISIHSKLDHPSILKLYTFFEDDDYVYIVLELCPNGHLEQWIKRNKRPFTEKEAQEYLAQVVDGMLYLHSRGIMHRDLTLTNLLIDAKGKIKISDFGLATQLKTPDEKHMTMCGTPNYISPEVASRKSHGLESDVWNFGCLVYTMLVGKPPFEANFVRATLNNVLYGNYKFPPYLSEKSRDLISQCLRRNPKERIKLIDVLRHPFFDSLHESKKHSGVFRSDSGVYTISTNATTQHAHTVGESDEYCIDGYSNQGGLPVNHRHPALNSPPVRLKANPNEHPYQCNGLFGNLKKQFPGLPYMNRNDPPLDPRTMLPLGDYSSKHSTDDHFLSNYVGTPPQSLPMVIPVIHDSAPWKNMQPNPLFYEEYSDRVSRRDYICGKSQEPPSSEQYLRLGKHSRRSISSDSHLLSQNEQKGHQQFAGIPRSNSLDRFEEERKQNRLPTNHCLKCFEQHSLSSQCGGHHINPHAKQKYGSSLSCNMNSKSSEILKDITPVRRTPSPRSPSPPKPSTPKKGPEFSPNLQKQCSPLSTRRLRATRQQTKNVILNIFDDGDVCLEFLHKKKSQKKIVDVCRISHDGLKIRLYKPKDSTEIPLTSKLAMQESEVSFTYESLPRKYWKKYIYAARFVKLVKAKTPKVTYYSDQAKCYLMENSPNADFEALFFTGEKILLSSNKVQISRAGEKLFTADQAECWSSIGGDLRLLYEHACQMKQHCLALENILTKLESSAGIPNFPAIIGRRPSSSIISPPPNRGTDQKENLSPTSVQSSRIQSAVGHLGTFEGSLSSVGTINSYFSKLKRSPLSTNQGINILNSQKLPRETEVIVENIGTAFKDDRSIGVEYLDGTSLEVRSDEPSYLVFTDSTHQKHLYHKDAVPDSLVKKLWEFNEAIGRINPCGGESSFKRDGRVPTIKSSVNIFGRHSHLPKCIR